MEKVLLSQNDNFLRKAYGKALIPCMLSILSSNINILVDGIIVGQKLGIEALAALNLCIPVYLGLCVAGSFIVSGCAISASSAIGRNDMEEAQRYYQLSIGLCAAGALLVTAIGLLAPDAVPSILCNDETLYSMVRTYAYVTILGAVPKMILYVPFWFLRLDGRNAHVTAVMFVMAGGNILLDIIFLYGLDMGIFGAALASVIATAVAALLGFLFLCDKKSGFHFAVKFIPKRSEAAYILKNGSPAALNNLTQTLRVFVVNHIFLLYGSTSFIAMFAAINCIGEFSLCLIQGVPQAASAMLGIYCGEHDNGSARILMRLQWKYGRFYSLIFSVVIIAGAGIIAMLYGLEESLYIPMICLAVGIFPGLFIGIMSGYYNVSTHTGWSNMLIASRVFVFPAAALMLLYSFDAYPWLFLFVGEFAALAFWLVCIRIYHVKHLELSAYLLMDDRMERERKVLDFSVYGNVEDVCDACEKISEFCENNGMSMKQVMRMSLSMEELMTMIIKENSGQSISFDLRLFSVQGAKGIRILYDGREYNPFGGSHDEDDNEYLGVRMIYGMVETITYQRNFGMNMLRILI